jgi:predicted amidohydrolase YtcJ
MTAFKRALKLVPRAYARPTVTHCTLVNPSLVQRLTAVGAVPALFTTCACYDADKFVYYGEEMMKNPDRANGGGGDGFASVLTGRRESRDGSRSRRRHQSN